MKKLLSFACLIFFAHQLFAQDVIKKADGTVIAVKILSISKDSVFCNAVAGDSSFVVPKTDLESLQYSNGIRMNFELPVSVQSDSVFTAGNGDAVEDANQNYIKYKAASTGTLVSSMFFPLFGLIPAIACSSTTPLPSNLDIPDLQNASDPVYRRTYTEQARKIKSKKVWKNYAIGASVGVGVRVLFYAGIILLVSTIAVE